MTPRNLLLAALLAAPSAAVAQKEATKIPAGKAVSITASSMCGVDVEPKLGETITFLATCLKFCPTPAGYEGCVTGRTGTDMLANQRGGFFDEQLACTAHIGKPAQLQRVVADTDGGKWAVGNCPGEFGAAAEAVFARAKKDPSLYLSGLTIMLKASVRGKRFAPLLYQSLAEGDARVKALSLSLLRRNFINTSKPEERVFPPNEVLIPLMYDADATVAAAAVTAAADRIHQTKKPGPERVDEALSLLGPVAGTNDSFNPLPAGVNPPAPAARKTAIDEIGRLMTGSDKPTRHRVLRHLMRLPCEEGPIHKAAFELYFKILTPDTDFLRTEKKQKGADGNMMSREDFWADQLYQALFGAGDMAGSKNENPAGAKYSRNCIGPMRAN